MKAAIYNGMLTEGVQPVTTPCSTGNCTWPLTPTLAVCGGCIKSKYQTNCLQSVTLSDPCCNYTMPSGSVATLCKEVGGEGTGFQVMQSKGSFYDSQDPSRRYISNFDIFGAPFGTTTEVLWSNISTISSECALWMCVQALNTTTSSTRQTQLSIQDFASVINSTQFDDGSSGSDNIAFMPLPPSMSPRAQATYNLSVFSTMYLGEYLSQMINGTVFLDQVSSSPSSDMTQAIWNASSDLDSWIKNLALSMTNFIRTDNPQPDNMYNGVAFQLGYQVRWEWIILPATLVLTSALILIVTMIQTSRSPVRAWKGSPLILLFMNLDVDDRNQAVGRMDTFEGLQDLVGKRRVLMGTDTAGGRVLKVA